MTAHLATYFDAITLSYMAHKGQTRRDLPIPYWTHVSLVSATVAEWGGDLDQILAALGHDIIEDTGVGRSTIDALLGDSVGSIVQSLSASKDKTKEWTVRKLEYIAPFVHCAVNPKSYLVKLADAYSNMISFTNTAIRTGAPSGKANTINSYVALCHICLWHLERVGTAEQVRVARYNIHNALNGLIKANVCPDAELLNWIDHEDTPTGWYMRLEKLWDKK